MRVYREGPTTGDLPVYFTLDTGTTAQPGMDFETLAATVTIPAGQAMADIFVHPVDDASIESTENVQVKLTLPPTDVGGVIPYSLGTPSTGTVAISDNDVMGPLYGVSITATQNTTEGGGAGYFRVSRTIATSSPVTVTYQVSGTASSNDYSALTGSITIPAGATSADISVQAVDDLAVEGTEQLQVTLVSVSSFDYAVGTPPDGTISILDNDQPPPLPVITVAETQSTAEGTSAGWFRLSRSGVLSSTLIVKYEIDTFYSSADNGVDTTYLPGTSAGSPTQGTITFAAGSATADISVLSVDDSAIEGTEGLRISVVQNSPATYSLGEVTVGSLAIRDNDEVVVGPQVTSLGLVSDTGNSATDRVTYDPRLQGVVSGSFGTGTVRIDFDHNGDGAADGNVTVTSSGASFTYDPRVSDSGFANQIGVRTVSYRVVHLAANGSVLTTAGWEVFAFELEKVPSSGEIRMEGLQLLRDTGDDSADRVTVNPTLVGKVLGDFTGGTVRVEFDHAGNGTVDGNVNIAQSGTSFSYDPRVSQPSLETYEGALLIRHRLVRIGTGGAETAGAWADFDLVLEKAPASNLKVQGLHLWADDDGDFSSGRMLVAGQVFGPAPTGSDPSQTPGGGLPPGAFVSVEIDTDGDGVAEKEVVTGEDATFIFDPTLLGYGTHTIRARATEWRQEYAMDLKGEWATFTFTLVPPPRVGNRCCQPGQRHGRIGFRPCDERSHRTGKPGGLSGRQEFRQYRV